MGLGETGVRLPHNLLKFPKLAEEARITIVDALGGV
jgi:hypothetical protein